MKVRSEREVAQSCPTLSDPMDCSLPGSSAHGIFQARVLEWGAIAFSELRYSIILVIGVLVLKYIYTNINFIAGLDLDLYKLCYMPETNIMLCVHYITIKKNRLEYS